MCMTCPDGLREPAVGARGSLLVCAAGAAGAVDGHARHATPRRPQAGRRDGLTAPSLTRRLFWCRSALKVLSWWCGASARCPELLELAIQAPGCAAPSGRAAEPLREPSGRLRCGCAARPKSRRFPRGLPAACLGGLPRVPTRPTPARRCLRKSPLATTACNAQAPSGWRRASRHARWRASCAATFGRPWRSSGPRSLSRVRARAILAGPQSSVRATSRERAPGSAVLAGPQRTPGVPGRAKCKCGCAHIRT